MRITNATVIGPITNEKPYQFWKDGKKLADKWFKNDSEAIEWFKKHNPTAFKVGGVEMRVFNI